MPITKALSLHKRKIILQKMILIISEISLIKFTLQSNNKSGCLFFLRRHLTELKYCKATLTYCAMN